MIGASCGILATQAALLWAENARFGPLPAAFSSHRRVERRPVSWEDGGPLLQTSCETLP
jgi:hypothetical protein